MAGIPCPRVQSIMEQFNPALENLVYLGNNYLQAFHGESTLVLRPCPHWGYNQSSAVLTSCRAHPQSRGPQAALAPHTHLEPEMPFHEACPCYISCLASQQRYTRLPEHTSL